MKKGKIWGNGGKKKIRKSLAEAFSLTQQSPTDWGHPPNFLLVDFYNYGDPGPGSVFEVAAHWNNVTYHRPCCGVAGNAAPRVKSDAVLVAAMGCAALMVL